MHISVKTGIVTFLVASVAAYPSPSRPNIKPYPKTPSKAFPVSAARDPKRTCTVASGTGDATPAILAAAHKCNNGGTVYFPAGQTYTVATALDLTFLSSVDFAILGTIQFKDDLTYWQAHAFQYKFQTASLFWRFGGKDVNIYGAGTGVIDGLGNTWWKAWASNSSIARPILFGTDGLNGATISGLKMRNPPNWFNLYANSTDILVSDMDLSAVSNDSSVAVKNSDGWDTYRSSNVVIQNSVIHNTDDCVSFKPNSTDIIVQNLQCTGSHGISVGSLGQYQGEVDIAENIYIYNISMTNATDGARIKIWPGVAPGTTGSTAGGGTGYVRNITYDTYQNKNNDPLTQCYSTTAAVCAANPSTVVIEDILFKSFSGITSKKYDPVAGSLVCSSPTVCGNIVAKDIHVTVPSGKNATYTCTNMNNTQLGLNCA
ncbi:Exopolygalacturonase A protein [Rutstroemia sp. NJR-2017a WRK4]|nr:Exopolygalacturonase A protein [Rutstroemia sp. NJR-2017a WRK4]